MGAADYLFDVTGQSAYCTALELRRDGVDACSFFCAGANSINKGKYMKRQFIDGFFSAAACMALSALLFAGAGCRGQSDVAGDDAVDLGDAADLLVAREPAEDRVLATVDGASIMESDFLQEINMMMGSMQGRVPPEYMEAMRSEMAQRALDNMIVRQLLTAQADRDNVVVEEEEVQERAGMYTQNLPPGATLEEMLEQVNLTEEDFLNNIRVELRLNKLLEMHVTEAPEPSADEVEAFYEENKEAYFAMPESAEASHILIGAGDGADEAARDEARAKAADVRAQLLEGASFEELAAEVSDCPSGQQGGHLGTFGRGQMVPSFEAAVFSQEIGAIGEIVETDFGFHVIRVEDRSEASTQELDEEMREQIGMFLKSRSQEEGLRHYLDQLREQADIQMMEAP